MRFLDNIECATISGGCPNCWFFAATDAAVNVAAYVGGGIGVAYGAINYGVEGAIIHGVAGYLAGYFGTTAAIMGIIGSAIAVNKVSNMIHSYS